MEIKYPGSYFTPPEDPIDMDAVEREAINLALSSMVVLEIIEHYYRGHYSAEEMKNYLDSHLYMCVRQAEREAEDARRGSEDDFVSDDDYLEGA